MVVKPIIGFCCLVVIPIRPFRFRYKILMADFSFLNDDIRDHFLTAIREVCLRKPKNQADFIAKHLMHSADAVENSKRRLEEEARRSSEDAIHKEIQDEQHRQAVNVQNSQFQWNAKFAQLAESIATLVNSEPTLEAVLIHIATHLARILPGSTYVGKLSDDSPRSIVYLYPSTIPPLLEPAGITWNLFTSDATSIYIENTLLEEKIVYFNPPPRAGSLLLFRMEMFVLGVDPIGSPQLGIPEPVRDVLTSIIHLITSV